MAIPCPYEDDLARASRYSTFHEILEQINTNNIDGECERSRGDYQSKGTSFFLPKKDRKMKMWNARIPHTKG